MVDPLFHAKHHGELPLLDAEARSNNGHKLQSVSLFSLTYRHDMLLWSHALEGHQDLWATPVARNASSASRL